MSSSRIQRPAARQAASQQQAALTSLAGIAATRFKEQLTPMIARMVAALADVGQSGLDVGEVYARLRSSKLLRENSYAFLHLAGTGIERALERELEWLQPRPEPQRGTDGDADRNAHRAAPTALSLVPLEVMDSKVAFGAITRPFDIAHSEQLATLSVRLGLLMGKGVLRAEANPFRPEVFLKAIEEAWCEFEPEQASHGLVLALLRPELVFDFAPLYEALIAGLAGKEGQAGAAEACRIQKTDDAAAARAARASGKAALAAQLRKLFGGGDDSADHTAAVPLIPNLPDMPSGGGWRPSAAAGFAQAAAAGMSPDAAVLAPAQAAPLLELLARIEPTLPAQAQGQPQGQPQDQPQGQPQARGALPHNVFYLPRFAQSLPPGSLSRGDESTLGLLSRVFETVLLDDSIPPQTRALLQLLQMPVLKAALLDKNFFFEEAHPARRMVDLLSRMGWEQRKDRDDPLFQVMQRSVERAGRAGPEAFAEAVAELEAGIAAEESAQQQAIAGPVASALKQEQLQLATRAARDAIALRVQAGDVGEVVGGFLQQRWTTVLTFAYSIEADKPGAVGNATRAMDELIWSVKPKATQEQRKALIGKLPRLLSTLNKWLDAIKWQDAERLQFFARLAECHASIVRAPLELSPERQLELAVEAAQQDALRRVELEQAAAEQEAARRQAISPADGLERGMWFEFRSGSENPARRKVKLAWVSPLRTLFIFSGAGRREAFSLSAEKLAEALHAGTARVLAIDGVVGQVLSEAMGQGAVNDAAMKVAS